MTKTQIWLAGFVLLFVALFILGRLTKKDDSEKEMAKMEAMMQQGQQQESPADQLMNKLNCTRCHGGDLKGTAMGPSLRGLNAGWKRDDLINYLRNPSSYMSTDKFKAYKEKFGNVMMPAFNNVDVKDLGKIADHLLNLK